MATTSAKAMAVGSGLPEVPAPEVVVASMASIASPVVGEGPMAGGVVVGVVVEGAEPLPAAVAGAGVVGVVRGFAWLFDDADVDVELSDPPDDAVGRGAGGAAGASFTIAVHSAFGYPEIPHTSPAFARIDTPAFSSTANPVSPSLMRTQARLVAGGLSPDGASVATP